MRKKFKRSEASYWYGYLAGIMGVLLIVLSLTLTDTLIFGLIVNAAILYVLIFHLEDKYFEKHE